MNEPESHSIGGRWWPRFDAYVLEDGVIKPAPGANIDWYDPWSEDRQGLAASEETRAYKSLLRLVNDLMATDPRAQIADLSKDPFEWSVHSIVPDMTTLPRKAEKLLLEWCRRNGLLGLLPQQIVEVTLAPTWVEPSRNFTDEFLLRPGARMIEYRHQASDLDSRGRLGLVGMQPSLRYGPWGWGVNGRTAGTQTFDRSLEGTTVDPSLWGNDFVPPCGLYSDDFLGTLTREPLPGRWSRFFPELNAEEAVLNMGNSKTWGHYGEPLSDFVRAGQRLADALREIPPRGRTPGEQGGVAAARACRSRLRT